MIQNQHFIYMAYIFVLFSILGWIIETSITSIKNSRIVNRGLLFNFYCPSYGLGGIAIYISSLVYYSKINFFLAGFLYCYFICAFYKFIGTHFYISPLFNRSGRILSVKAFLLSTAFGALSILLGIFVFPMLDKFADIFIDATSNRIILAIIGCIVIDFILSIRHLSGLRRTLECMTRMENEVRENLSKIPKGMDEDDERLRSLEAVATLASGYNKTAIYCSRKYRRIITAYPNIKSDKFRYPFGEICKKVNNF